MDERAAETLRDMLEIIERIALQTSRLSKAQFLADSDAQDATAYRILAIGEIAKSLPSEVKERHPHIPWKQIISMRNLLAHEYFVRESEIIWETLQAGLPMLQAACEAELRLAAPD